MLAEIQQELLICLRALGFVRRSRSDDALFISDAPRHADAQQLSSAMQRLTQLGFVVTQTESHLWKINLNDDRFRALFPRGSGKQVFPFPTEKSAYLAVYELACLLSTHADAWELQPKAILCLILKSAESTVKMNHVAPALLEECAARLRKGQTLPSEAAGLLFRLIRPSTKEE